MLTAIVTFRFLPDASRGAPADLLRQAAPQYLGHGGLVSQTYLFDRVTYEMGGCYVFEDRAAMVSLFDDKWRRSIEDQFGDVPTIRVFETPFVVDNIAGRIIKSASFDASKSQGVTVYPSATESP